MSELIIKDHTDAWREERTEEWRKTYKTVKAEIATAVKNADGSFSGDPYINSFTITVNEFSLLEFECKRYLMSEKESFLVVGEFGNVTIQFTEDYGYTYPVNRLVVVKDKNLIPPEVQKYYNDHIKPLTACKDEIL